MTTTVASPPSILWPWLDRRGRFSALKAVVLAALVAPGVMLAVQWLSGALMPRPLNAVIHGTGLWAVRFLLVSLALTPLRQGFGYAGLVLIRRMVGVGAFAYVAAHFLLYVGDQGFDLFAVGREIALRFYLTIGFVALLGLGALAATSTDGMVKRLGATRWRRLHRLVYGIAVLALVHFFLQAKADPGEATMAAGIYFWAMARRRWSSGGVGWLAVMPLIAAIGAALAEAALFLALRGIDPLRVLATDLDFSFGPRPAPVAGLIVLAVEVAGFAVRRYRAAGRVGGAPRPGLSHRAGSGS